MGWYDYYRLLKDYDGDINKVPKADIVWAARMNPNNPRDALKLAQKRIAEEAK